MNDFILSRIFLSFSTNINVVFTPPEKSVCTSEFNMVMKQPTLAPFHLKKLSNDQDKPSLSTSGENTDACSPLIPKFHFNETTD